MSTEFESTGNQAPPAAESDVREFSAPLGDVTKGRLVVSHGIANATLHVDTTMPDLYRARIEDPEAEVEVSGGTVTIHRVRPPLGEWLKHVLDFRKRPMTVVLNGSIPWEIDVRGGVSQVHADLTDLELRALSIGGGVSNVTFHRPTGIAARIQTGGGIARLTFDDQQFSGISGTLRQETPNYQRAADRYAFELKGGVSNATVDSR